MLGLGMSKKQLTASRVIFLAYDLAVGYQLLQTDKGAVD
jgi:hypothetical protein